MKRFLLLSLAAGLTMTAGCSKKGTMKTNGLDISNLDTTVSCKDDFYQYACGGWMEKNPLKPEYSRYGSFDQLVENNQNQLKELVEELGNAEHEAGSVAQKVADLYLLGLDSVRLNQEGGAPVAGELKAIGQVNDKAGYARTMARLQKIGASPFFSFYVGADDMNSTQNLAGLYQSGMSMGDRDYYLVDDSTNLRIREAYAAYIEKLFALAGYTPEEAQQASRSVLKTETALAQVAFSREQMRNPLENYNKMPFDRLVELTPAIDWDAFFQELGIAAPAEINPSQLPFIKGMNAVVAGMTPEEMRHYLAFKLLDQAASYLNDDFAAAQFDFYGKTLSGRQEMKPRWKRSLAVVDGALPEALGEMYVTKYFPPEAKEKMLDLVKNLQVALGQHIDALEWMSDSTKTKAQEKLSTIYIKIGYPDRFRDYTALTIDKNASYWENVCKANEFEYGFMLQKMGQPVDKDEWYMSPQTVNAYYNPTTNEICFPAGILQPPFFTLGADDAVNYGAIGVVIGHEMTHGFDDQGRQYDKEGNLKDWWLPEDAAQFTLRADKLADQYSRIVVLDDVHANGRYTLGENIADQGGLRVAYTAFKNATQGQELPPLDGFTPEQRFYLSYAGVWATNIRDEEILRLTKIDSHSLGKWRVNAALRNIDTFFDAFGIVEGDPMYLAPEERVIIW